MKVYFCTLGCKVNQAETRELKKQFLESGYLPVSSLAQADIAVFNSCTVTHIAERKLRNYVRRLLKTNPGAQLYICGCYAELREAELKKNFPQAVIIKKAKKLNIKEWGIKSIPLLKTKLDFDTERIRQFLKIEDGCDQFCAYCVIPYARGPVVSYDPKQILVQAKELVAQGAKELIVTGINTGKYDWQGYDLADLLVDLEKISGLVRIRVSSVEPNYVSEKLLRTIADSAKLCRHLHVPIQSGSDRILRLMGRPYDLPKYMKLIEQIRRIIPSIGLTTDLIIGFPGETDKTFNETKKILREIEFSDIHMFKYSVRPGTKAEKFDQFLTPPGVQAMLDDLQKLNDKYRLKFAKNFLNKPTKILVHEQKQKLYKGLNSEYVPVISIIKAEIGQVRTVLPKNVSPEGELLI